MKNSYPYQFSRLIFFSLALSLFTKNIHAAGLKSHKGSALNIAATTGSDADLSRLMLSTGPLNYTPGTPVYTSSVAFSVTSTTLNATTVDPAATFTVNGTPLASGVQSGQIPLVVGPNTITILVTAQDGVTQKTYTVTVTRAGNTVLASLKLSSGPLTYTLGSPFYTSPASYSTTSTIITTSTQDPTSTMTLNGAALTNGVASNPIALFVGQNVIPLIVTAQDGVTKQTYTITITRAAPPAPHIAYSGPQTYTVGAPITSLSPTNSGGPTPTGTFGSTTPIARSTNFGQPIGIAVAKSGNVYVNTRTGSTFKITPNGVVTTPVVLAINGLDPEDIAVDAAENLYFGIGQVVKVTPGGAVTNYGTQTTGGGVYSIVLDHAGNAYISDRSLNHIVKVTPAGATTLVVSKPAGSPPAANTLAGIEGFAIDAQGNFIIADYFGNSIKKVTTADAITTISQVGQPHSVALDASGNIYVAHGSGGFGEPYGITYDGIGYMYYTDYIADTVAKKFVGAFGISPALPTGLTFDPVSGTISGTPLASSPATNYTITASNAGGSSSSVVNIKVNASAPPAISYAGPQVYTVNTPITALLPSNSGGVVPDSTYGATTTYVTSNSTNTFYSPKGIVASKLDNLYMADTYSKLILRIKPGAVIDNYAGETGSGVSLNKPYGVAVDTAENVYIADTYNNKIWKETSDEVITLLAGSGAAGFSNGTGAAASFNTPIGIAVDVAGNVYVGDQGNNSIRKITPAGVVSTFAGSGTAGSANGTGTAASFHGPGGIAFDATGNLYVADCFNNLIRKITPARVVSTFAGSGSPGSANGNGAAASFNNPHGVTVDQGGSIFVADLNVIRRISTTGNVSTLAGSGTASSVNGTGTAATFDLPYGITVDYLNNVYVAENSIFLRRVSATGYTISPALPAGLVFNASTGAISGTPTAAAPAANYTITAYNTGGSSAAVVNITVNATPSPNIIAALDASFINNLAATEPLVHQGVSPNGDGINDALTIDGIANYPDNRVIILDRSGTKVFEATGYNNITRAFDGHSSINGRKQPAGTYFYVLQYNVKGVLTTKTGYLMLKY